MARQMSLPFFSAGDVYDAWLVAYQARLKRHHDHERLPAAHTWNELTPYEMETYFDMAERLNGQLEGLILDAIHHLLTEEKVHRDHRCIETE